MIYLKIKNHFHFSYRNMIHHILDSFRVFGENAAWNMLF